jgi:hypothetical protein
VAHHYRFYIDKKVSTDKKGNSVGGEHSRLIDVPADQALIEKANNSNRTLTLAPGASSSPPQLDEAISDVDRARAYVEKELKQDEVIGCVVSVNLDDIPVKYGLPELPV